MTPVEALAKRLEDTLDLPCVHTKTPYMPKRVCEECIATEALAYVNEVIESEEELDGPMPDELFARCATKEGATDVMRAAARATKKSIRALLGLGDE